MALFVETPDVRILFDAGVSLGPLRYSLPPHPEEFRALRKLRLKVLEYAEKAEVITISHYHRDHFTPPYPSLYECTEEKTFLEIYYGKTLLAKSPRSKINYNQKKRAFSLQKALEKANANARMVFFDSETLRLGDTVVEGFLAPHGEEKLGWVLCFKVYRSGEPVLVFLPDVQGPVSQEALRVLLTGGFKIAVIGGPPIYLSRKESSERIEEGMKNLARALEVERLNILSHHILRDPDWRSVLDLYAPKAKFSLYSEIAGFEATLLEAYRNVLYEEDPPEPSYLKGLREKTLSCSDF